MSDSKAVVLCYPVIIELMKKAKGNAIPKRWKKEHKTHKIITKINDVLGTMLDSFQPCQLAYQLEKIHHE